MNTAAYHQRKREAQLTAMRAAFRVKENIAAVQKAERTERMIVLLEIAEQRRALEAAERRRIQALNINDPEHPLYRIAHANTLAREFDEAEIAALNPCGRFAQLQRNGLGSVFSLDVKHAVALGATLSDLTFVAGALTRFSEEADRRYKLWRERCKGRGQTYQLQAFIEVFSEDGI